MQGFGEVCRRVRMARGLSQVHVARTGGLQQARVSEIEHGVYTPGLEQALKLARGMGVKLADLVAVWEGDVKAGELAEGRQARGGAKAGTDAMELERVVARAAEDAVVRRVLPVIEELAEQTRLLALNAKVEGAVPKARITDERLEVRTHKSLKQPKAQPKNQAPTEHQGR